MELIMLIGIWIIVIMLLSIFFQGAFKENKMEENKIEIKYRNLEDYNTLLRDVHKCEKEFGSFLAAVLKYDKENCIEEYYDSIMEMNNILNRLGVPKKVISDRQVIYYEKLKEQGLKLI